MYGYPTPRIVWIFLLPFGLFIIAMTFLGRLRYVEHPILICPKCAKSFYEKDVEQRKCPYCKIDLEKIRGFYDRHPELNMTESFLTYKTKKKPSKLYEFYQSKRAIPVILLLYIIAAILVLLFGRIE
jgi:hypothetical protein